MAGTPQYATLVANTPVTLNFDQDFDRISVVNRDGADEIFFTVNGSTPAVNGTGSFLVTKGVGAYLEVPVVGSGNTVVKLISASATKVGVDGTLG